MKTILILTDFSSRAECATEYALCLAVKCQWDIVLCNAMELTTHIADGLEFNWPVNDYLKLQNESIDGLKELKKRLKKTIAKDRSTLFEPKIELVSEFGLLSEIAEKVVNDKGIGLVVIGQHRSGGLSRFLFGSHTYSMLDKINCPVLIVPESVEFESITNIAYATDRSFNDSKVIQYLVDLAKHFQATVSVNHISAAKLALAESEQARESRLNEQLGSNHPSVAYRSIKAENVKASLINLMNDGNADIFTLVHKQYEFLEGLFHASISKRMADNAEVPLLILPYSFSQNVADISEGRLEQFCFDSSR